MRKPLPMDEQKKSIIWQEWERGTPMSNIARVIEKPPAMVFSYLQYHGSIRPRRRRRCARALNLDSKKTEQVVPALARQMSNLPDQLKQSLTWDRGTELAAHQKFTVATEIDLYFCDPSSPWQRGTNENTNGFLRQYFPKGSCLAGYSQKDLDDVARHLLNSRPRINSRPRKTLGFQSPSHRLEQVLR